MLTSPHNQVTKNRATDLYFMIEKHFAMGGTGLRVLDIRDMLKLKSNSTALVYIQILKEWGLINHDHRTCRTIVLAKTNYPPVEYRRINKEQ